MSLSHLEITSFRNLHHVSIEPDAGLNLITGINAAGKTSLLESIFYLSYGRSFRSSQTRDLITHGEDFFRLLARLNSTSIGVQKSIKQQQARINGEDVKRISDLSALLPVIALHPDSHQLISSGPEHTPI